MHVFTLEDLQRALDSCKNAQDIVEERKKKEKQVEENENLGHKSKDLGNFRKAIEYYQKQLEVAKNLEDNKGIGKAHTNMGSAYRKIGQYQKAIDCYLKHLKIAEELGDRRGLGKVHGDMGMVYYSLGQYQHATDCHRKDLQIAEELGDKGGIERASLNLGNAYLCIGHFQNAIDCYRKGLKIASELANKIGIATAHANMGIVYHSIGEYQRAIDSTRMGLSITEELGDKRGAGTAYGSLGCTYNRIGQHQKAIDCHRKDLEIAEELGDKRGMVRAHGNIGNACHGMGQFLKEIDSRRKELEIAEELGDKSVAGRAYTNMGNAYANINQYQKAIACHRKYLKLAEELGDKKGLGRAHANMGKAYLSIGQHQTAVESFHKQVEIAEELGTEMEVAVACGNLGCAYENIGEYQRAIECHRRHLQIAERLGNIKEVGKVNGNIGNTYNRIGQYQQAIDCHTKDLGIAVKLADKVGIGRAQANMGNVYENISLYQNAIDCYREHLTIAEELKDKRWVGIAYGNLGNVYHEIGEYDKAIDNHRKCLEISKELGDKQGQGRAHGNIANALDCIGEYCEGIGHHRRHLEIAEEFGDKVGVARAHGNIGNAYDRIGQYQTAINYHRKHLEIAEEVDDKQGVGTALGNMGIAFYHTGDYEKAINCHRKHLEVAREIGNIRGMARAQCNLGTFHQFRYESSLACSMFAKSILSYQSIRSSAMYQDEFNTSMSNAFASVHKRLGKSLLNLKQVKVALLVSDSGKAKALYDLIRRSIDDVIDSATDGNNTFPIQVISENPCSEKNETFLHDVLSKVIHSMHDGSIVSYMFDNVDQRDLHAWVISRKGVFYKRWQTTNGMSARTYLNIINDELRKCVMGNIHKGVYLNQKTDSIHGSLMKKDKLIDISEKEIRKNNFVRDLERRVQNLMKVNRSSKPQSPSESQLYVKCIKGRYNLDCPTTPKVGFHSSSSKPSDENDEDERRLLGRYLLERPTLTQNRLNKETSRVGQQTGNDAALDLYLEKQYSAYISPIEEYLVGSKILIVPEGSLFTTPFCALLNSRKEHLCDRYSLQFTPALHVLNASLSIPLPVIGPALFVGNPIVGEVRFNNVVQLISQLPNAKIEAEECSKYFSAEPLLEENATKENVLNKMKDASVIHIAAHGRMDHSDIFLTPNEGAPKPPNEEDYLLTAKDIVQCTLNARLVVLSCCHSGRGQVSAEGVVGIARSFLGAGARSILVTLWRIPDKETMELMKSFYAKVMQGLSVCVALQQTMIEFKTKYSVATWVYFQVLGEDISLTKDEIEEIRRLSSIRCAQQKITNNQTPDVPD